MNNFIYQNRHCTIIEQKGAYCVVRFALGGITTVKKTELKSINQIEAEAKSLDTKPNPFYVI